MTNKLEHSLEVHNIIGYSIHKSCGGLVVLAQKGLRDFEVYRTANTESFIDPFNLEGQGKYYPTEIHYGDLTWVDRQGRRFTFKKADNPDPRIEYLEPERWH